MFNNNKIYKLEQKVKLLIEDTLEQFGKISNLETEVVILKRHVKDLETKKKRK